MSLGINLARKGIEVDVYEKRDTVVASPGRLTNLYLSYRGIAALHNLGYNIYDMYGETMINSFILHNARGESQTVAFPGKDCFMLNIDRHNVYEYLLD